MIFTQVFIAETRFSRYQSRFSRSRNNFTVYFCNTFINRQSEFTQVNQFFRNFSKVIRVNDTFFIVEMVTYFFVSYTRHTMEQFQVFSRFSFYFKTILESNHKSFIIAIHFGSKFNTFVYVIEFIYFHKTHANRICYSFQFRNRVFTVIFVKYRQKH